MGKECLVWGMIKFEYDIHSDWIYFKLLERVMIS